jgi:hypothetical protein
MIRATYVRFISLDTPFGVLRVYLDERFVILLLRCRFRSRVLWCEWFAGGIFFTARNGMLLFQ